MKTLKLLIKMLDVSDTFVQNVHKLYTSASHTDQRGRKGHK